jgi:hypothetical protein
MNLGLGHPRQNDQDSLLFFLLLKKRRNTMETDDLCAYRNILGKPHEGFHRSRIGPFAAGDLLLTIIAALVLAMVFRGDPARVPASVTTQASHFLAWFLLLLVLAELLHALFCVKTEGLLLLQRAFDKKEQKR